MKQIPIIALILLAALSSCKTQNKKAQSTYNVNLENFCTIDKIFSSYHYVMLETLPNTIISHISNIKIADNKIFILNNYNNYNDRILIFDIKGKYLSSVDKRGRGHGEYMEIDDFKVIDSSIYALSRGNKKINIYDFNGNFQSSIKLNDWYENFEVVNSEIMYLYSERSNNQTHNFIVYDYKNDKYINKFDEFDDNGGIGVPVSPFHKDKSDNRMFVTLPYDYTIYELTPKSFQPLYKIDFNEHSIPLNDRSLSYSDLYDKYVNKPFVRYFHDLNMVNSNAYITYRMFFEGAGILELITKIAENDSVYTYRFRGVNEKKFPYTNKPVLFYDDYVVSYRDAFDILRLEDFASLSHFKNLGLKEESNPVLFFNKLK